MIFISSSKFFKLKVESDKFEVVTAYDVLKVVICQEFLLLLSIALLAFCWLRIWAYDQFASWTFLRDGNTGQLPLAIRDISWIRPLIPLSQKKIRLFQ